MLNWVMIEHGPYWQLTISTGKLVDKELGSMLSPHLHQKDAECGLTMQQPRVIVGKRPKEAKTRS